MIDRKRIEVLAALDRMKGEAARPKRAIHCPADEIRILNGTICPTASWDIAEEDEKRAVVLRVCTQVDPVNARTIPFPTISAVQDRLAFRVSAASELSDSLRPKNLGEISWAGNWSRWCSQNWIWTGHPGPIVHFPLDTHGARSVSGERFKVVVHRIIHCR